LKSEITKSQQPMAKILKPVAINYIRN